MFNKNFLTNLIALLFTIIGYLLGGSNHLIFNMGIFALSGAVTNSLAIHMLFEKIPLIYGSGVILNRFADFKAAIKDLIISEFFSKAHIEKFFVGNDLNLSADKINQKIDFDKIFNELVDAIINSPLGGMLAMVGGKEALAPLKEPVTEKLKNIIAELVAEHSSGEGDLIASLHEKISVIIDKRLADLTPQMVKEIIQKMIREHLGWLVVWGGICGGLIGLIYSLI